MAEITVKSHWIRTCLKPNRTPWTIKMTITKWIPTLQSHFSHSIRQYTIYIILFRIQCGRFLVSFFRRPLSPPLPSELEFHLADLFFCSLFSSLLKWHFANSILQRILLTFVTSVLDVHSSWTMTITENRIKYW